jgi:hypothetical protein
MPRSSHNPGYSSGASVVRRDAHRFVALLRISDVPRRQGGSETERACRQQHVLYRRIDPIPTILPIGYPIGQFGPIAAGTLSEVVYLEGWGKPYPEI